MNWKPYEPTLHQLMGLGAGILNLGLLLDLRERNQLPPENDAYPVVWVTKFKAGDILMTARSTPVTNVFRCEEYWSAIRTMDTLNDMRDYARGQTVAWFFVLGVGIWIGRALG